MFSIDIIGEWDFRSQSLPSIAEATAKCLATMPTTPSGKWVATRFVGGRYVDSPIDVQDVSQLTQMIDEVTRENQVPPGYSVKLYKDIPGDDYAVEFDIRAGFDKPGVGNHILVRILFDTDVWHEIEDAIHGYMTALVRAWRPDHLAAHTYEVMKAQGRAPGQMYVGWQTYFADHITLNTEDVDAAVSVVHADGGRYFTVGGTPRDPDMSQVQSIRRALGY